MVKVKIPTAQDSAPAFESNGAQPVPLYFTLYEAVSKATRLYDVHVQTKDSPLGSHAFSTNRFATVISQITALARRGKDAYPLCAYDPDMRLALNKRKYFSGSIGFYFDRQRQRIVEDLLLGKPATMMLTSEYGLEGKSQTIVRPWTITFRYIKGRLITTTVFGHCEVFPGLLYDIASIEAISHWFKGQVSAQAAYFSWFFHTIQGNGNAANLVSDSRFTLSDIPKSPAELVEWLRLEEIMRNDKPAIMPMPQIPLGKELGVLLNRFYANWRPNNGASTPTPDYAGE